MVVCAYTFATMATKYSYVNGLVDYAEVTCGSKYAYLIGWFMTIIYYPTLTSVLAWVSARYFCVLLGWDITGGSCLAIAAFFLCTSYAVNALSPVLAGKFQVTTTVIKLIPLILMKFNGGTLPDADILSILQIRKVLTKLALELAIPKITDDEVKQLFKSSADLNRTTDCMEFLAG